MRSTEPANSTACWVKVEVVMNTPRFARWPARPVRMGGQVAKNRLDELIVCWNCHSELPYLAPDRTTGLDGTDDSTTVLAPPQGPKARALRGA